MKKTLLPLALAVGIVAGIAVLANLRFPETSETPSPAPDRNVGAPLDSEVPTAPNGDAVCTADYAPVCAKNGRTYSNACMAERDGQTVDRIGMCSDVETSSASGTATSEIENLVRETLPEGELPGSSASGAVSESALETPSTESGTASDAPAVEASGTTASGSSAFLEYSNVSVGYAFSLPKRSYYSGFGARDGATHSVGVSRGVGPEDFETSEVKIRFYRGKTLPQLSNAENGFYEDPSTGTAYLSLSGSTLTIEGNRAENADIIDTVIRTAKVR